MTLPGKPSLVTSSTYITIVIKYEKGRKEPIIYPDMFLLGGMVKRIAYGDKLAVNEALEDVIQSSQEAL